MTPEKLWRRRWGFGLMALACLSVAAGPAGRRLVDRVAARVNDEIITENEVLTAAASDLGGATASDSRATLRAMIDERLLAQAARKEIREIPEERIANRVEAEVKARRALFPSEEAFLEAIGERGWDLESYKDSLRRQEERAYAIRLALGRRVRMTDEDVAAYEDQLRRSGKPLVQYRLRQVFLALPLDAPQGDVARAERKMLDLLGRIRRGVAFEQVAAAHSDDKAARVTGGDIGWMDRKTMQPSIRKAVETLESGDVSQPVRTEKGLHLFQVIARRTPREMLFEKRLEEVRRKWLAELRRAGQVDVLLPHLK